MVLRGSGLDGLVRWKERGGQGRDRRLCVEDYGKGRDGKGGKEIEGRKTYEYGSEVRFYDFGFPVAAYHRFPNGVEGGCVVVMGDREERAIPSSHTVGLFVPEDQILENILFITSAAVRVGE